MNLWVSRHPHLFVFDSLVRHLDKSHSPVVDILIRMKVISGVEILIKVEVIYDLTSYKCLYNILSGFMI